MLAVRGERRSGADIIGYQFRKILDDLLWCQPDSQLFLNVVHHDTQAANTALAFTLARFDGDSFAIVPSVRRSRPHRQKSRLPDCGPAARYAAASLQDECGSDVSSPENSTLGEMRGRSPLPRGTVRRTPQCEVVLPCCRGQRRNA